MTKTTTDIAVSSPVGAKERRASRRSKVARKVLVCPSEPPFSEEVQPSLNVSRGGLYFVTPARHYYAGMRVSVISGYAPNDPCNTTSFGEVVRIDKLEDGKFGIAVRIRLA